MSIDVQERVRPAKPLPEAPPSPVLRQPTRGDAGRWILAALVAAGAVLRFSTLDVQSYWFDETVTVVDSLRPSLGDTLSGLSGNDMAPPLYFIVAWGWSELFGTMEAALRSLSAVFGTLTIPVLYAAAAELAGRRAGLVTAALVTFSPILIWYSQEARPYAMFVLLGAVSLLAFARFLARPEPARAVAWAIACAAVLLVHYFAFYFVAAQVVWLLVALPGARRLVATAACGLGLAGVALLPLLGAQRDTGGANWITQIPLDERLRDIFENYLASVPSAANPVWPLIAAAAALAAVLLWRRIEPQASRAAFIGFGLAAATLAVPLALAVAGADYFYWRHLIVALVPLLVGAGAVFGARRAGRAGIVVTAIACLGWLTIDLAVPFRSDLHRDDWRGATEALGTPTADRAIVLQPDYALDPLIAYGHAVRPLPSEGAHVQEVVLLGIFPDAAPEPSALPGFTVTEQREIQNISLIRLQARGPRPVDAAELAAAFGRNPSAVVIDPAPG